MITGYEIAVSSLAPATATAYAVLWSPTRRLKVREVEIFNSSGSTNLAQVQLIRASARGTASTTVTPTAAADAQDIADINPTALVDTAWTVQPTLAANPLRMPDISGTVGSGPIWQWQLDGELIIPIGGGLCVQNASGVTGAICRIMFLWGE